MAEREHGNTCSGRAGLDFLIPVLHTPPASPDNVVRSNLDGLPDPQTALFTTLLHCSREHPGARDHICCVCASFPGRGPVGAGANVPEHRLLFRLRTGDVQPTWQDTPETDPSGRAKISSVTGSLDASDPPANPDPRRAASDGLNAFELGGSQTGVGRGYAYYRVFAVQVPSLRRVSCPMTSSPYARPSREPSNPSTYAAVDLHFTDGTYLSDLGRPGSVVR